jgi:hypothetical protein
VRRPARSALPPGSRPLRRTPKRLDAEPTLYEPAGGGGGFVASAGGARRDAGSRPARGSGTTGFTDEPAELLAEVPAEAEPDAEAVRRAHRIAARLAVPRPSRSQRDVTARLGHRVAPAALLDTLLRIPARGLTNVSFPLVVAKRQLVRVPARDARVLLLSDCVHNAGPDPRFAAAGLPRLDVLLDASGEHDTDLGRDLARLGRGRLAVVHRYTDVAPAVTRLFGG